jgi:hypothetical protein
MIGFREDGKKKGSKFLNLTISRTFAFPKKTVDQCDKCVFGVSDRPA